MTSNEPDDDPGNGDGETSLDIQGFEVGTRDTAGSCEQSGPGPANGRIYTLTYMARARALNEHTCTTTVTVPHDRH